MTITKEFLEEKLNQICLKEFEDNYNKGECARIFYDNPLAKEFEKELNEHCKEGYRFSVSDAGVLTLEQFEESIGDAETWKVVRTICAPLIYKLPYAYVMGRPISKAAMLKVVAQYEA